MTHREVLKLATRRYGHGASVSVHLADPAGPIWSAKATEGGFKAAPLCVICFEETREGALNTLWAALWEGIKG